MLPRQDTRRACLRIDEWPANDQAAWQRILAREDSFDEQSGAAAHWSTATAENYRKGYGRWLTFLKVTGLLDPATDPADRVTRANVHAYSEELRRSVSPYTHRNRLGELLAVVGAFAPDRDWSSLKAAVNRLDNAATPTVLRDDRPMVSPAEVSAWALETMTAIAAEPPTWRNAVDYRNALLLAMLSLCPGLRRGNFAQMQIGKHLIGNDAGYTICFSAKEMKQRRPRTEVVPEELTTFIQTYLGRFRPLLLKGRDSLYFWIADRGIAMTGKAVYDRVTKTTSDIFGIAMTPHMFRSAAVTELALHAPTTVRSGQQLLGHSVFRITDDHYIKAGGLEASRRYRSTIDVLKERIKHLLPHDEATDRKIKPNRRVARRSRRTRRS